MRIPTHYIDVSELTKQPRYSVVVRFGIYLSISHWGLQSASALWDQERQQMRAPPPGMDYVIVGDFM